jgi:predicted anti-sigma-YlaC factor YlaD
VADVRASECERFDEHAAELALRLLDPVQADALVAHARGCPRCRAQLDGLADVADRLTLLAPEADPPPGFESRALAAMGAETRHARPVRWLRTAVAAAALVALGLGAGLLAGHDAPATRTVVVSAVLDPARPALTMSLDGADDGETYRCSLRTPDGTTIEVAAWTVRDGGGTWTVPLDTRLASATAAIVTDGDGRTVATAPLR